MRKKPVPRGTPRRMPAQKAHAPRNSPAPPPAGAKGPCPAELPATCRRKRPLLRGTPRRRMPAERHPAKRQTIPSLAQPSHDKNNDLSGQKGTAADFFTSPPETGAAPLPEAPSEGSRRRHTPKPHPKARTETPSEDSRRGHAPKSRRRCGIRPPPHPLNRPGRVVKKGHPADRRHRQKTTRFSSPEGINNRIINQICPQKNRINHQKIFNPFAFGFHFMYLCRRGV